MVNARLENDIDNRIPFLDRSIPMINPNSPVVKRRMIASSTLTKISINVEEISTAKPRDI